MSSNKKFSVDQLIDINEMYYLTETGKLDNYTYIIRINRTGEDDFSCHLDEILIYKRNTNDFALCSIAEFLKTGKLIINRLNKFMETTHNFSKVYFIPLGTSSKTMSVLSQILSQEGTFTLRFSNREALENFVVDLKARINTTQISYKCNAGKSIAKYIRKEQSKKNKRGGYK